MGIKTRRDWTSSIVYNLYNTNYCHNYPEYCDNTCTKCSCTPQCPCFRVFNPNHHNYHSCSTTTTAATTTTTSAANHRHSKSRTRQIMECNYVKQQQRGCTEFLSSSIPIVSTRVPVSLWRDDQHIRDHCQIRQPVRSRTESSATDRRQLEPRGQPPSSTDRRNSWQPDGNCSCPGPPSPPSRSRVGWSSEQLGPVWGGRGPGRPTSSNPPYASSSLQRSHAAIYVQT